jgi:hypothetical protein
MTGGGKRSCAAIAHYGPAIGKHAIIVFYVAKTHVYHVVLYVLLLSKEIFNGRMERRHDFNYIYSCNFYCKKSFLVGSGSSWILLLLVV